MTNPEDSELATQFEKVKDGLGPDEKTSYAPAETGEDAKQKAEDVEQKIDQDRKREDDR